MNESSQQPNASNAKDPAPELMRSFGDLAVRNAESANASIDKLAGLFIQTGFALGGLAAIRIQGHAVYDLPLSYIGLVLIGLSMIAGSSQFLFNYFFFKKSAEHSQKMATRGFGATYTSGDMQQQAQRGLVRLSQERDEMPRESTLCPTVIQCILLVLGVILVFIELPRNV